MIHDLHAVAEDYKVAHAGDGERVDIGERAAHPDHRERARDPVFRQQRDVGSREPAVKGGDVALIGDARGNDGKTFEHRVRVDRTVGHRSGEEALRRHTRLAQPLKHIMKAEVGGADRVIRGIKESPRQISSLGQLRDPLFVSSVVFPALPRRYLRGPTRRGAALFFQDCRLFLR